jgi:hypothetical protein
LWGDVPTSDRIFFSRGKWTVLTAVTLYVESVGVEDILAGVDRQLVSHATAEGATDGVFDWHEGIIA